MKKKLLSMLLCLTMLASYFIGFIPGVSVSAKTVYSNAASSLIVNILNADGTTTLVHEYQGELAGSYSVYDPEAGKNITYNYYSYPELENIAQIAYYSSIDAMPAAVGTKVLGVTIDDLVANARQYNSNIKWESGMSIRMYATDAAGYAYQGNNYYNYDFLEGQPRYYYPNLVEAYTLYRAHGEDPSYLDNALVNPVPVEAMFCLLSYQERYTTDAILKADTEEEYTFKPNDNPDDWRTITTPVQMVSKEAFRFCMGLTPDEAQQGINNTYSSTNKFCRWVYQIDIGPMKGPSLTADRTNNTLGQPIDITFPDNADWRSSITGITVDGATVAPAHYVISAGVITFDNTVFTTEASHEIVVIADGYINTKVTQAIQAAAAIAVTGVTLNKTSDTIVVGSTDQLEAIVSPDNATNKDVVWSSNNEGVATISDGLVTAVGAGTATITATTVDGGKKATCVVTVTTQSIAVTGVTLDKTTDTITVGSTDQLEATVSPSNATNKNVVWSSSNEGVAMVEDGLITAIGVGTATITAKTVDGGKKATCVVTITTQSIAVTGVTLNKTMDIITVNGTDQLKAKVSPSNATNKDVTWSSDNKMVATVKDGLVTAVAAGTANIIVTTSDGHYQATCTVIVKTSTNGIYLEGLTASIPLQLDNTGVTQDSVRLRTTNGKITLDILKGTKLSTADNTVLSFLTAEIIDSPQSTTAGTELIMAYELGPDGVTFDTPVTLSVSYGELPAGADEQTVRIVYWDGSSWEAISSNLNTVSKLVTANINSFGKYAVAVDILSSASFILSDLIVTPATVNPGEIVLVQATITNQGEITGNCRVSFTVNDVEVDTREIQLQPGQEQSLSYQIRRDEPGEYTVAVNDKLNWFVVELPSENNSSITAVGTTSPTTTVSSTGSEISSTTTLQSGGSNQSMINWVLITVTVLIGIGVVVMLFIILIRR